VKIVYISNLANESDTGMPPTGTLCTEVC